MKEPDYRRVTYDYTLAAAQVLARVNPAMTFVFVSGTGTDETEAGRSMWARVKGAAENAVRKLPFKATFMFRPGYIQPMHGIKSKTALYRAAYAVAGALYPAMKALFPKMVTSNEQVGRAMISVARHGYPKAILENADINDAAARVA